MSEKSKVKSGEFFDIPIPRIRHQVLRGMAEFRGWRKGQWR